MSETDPALELVPSWHGRNGKCTITARIGDTVVAVDELNSSSAADREAFTDRVLAACAGVDRELILAELLKLAGSRATKKREKDEAPAVAELVLQIAEAEAQLFHDRTHTAYARIRVDDHAEVWPVRSKSFRLWIRRRLREEHNRLAYGEAVQNVIEQIEAKAIFDGDNATVHVRVAEADGAVYLDLADEAWRVVKIDANGWGILDTSPVLFTRKPGMLALPEPKRGGSVDDLRPLVNVKGDGDFTILKGWLVGTFYHGPYTVLVETGEQGSAKTTTARMLRACVDPNSAPLRAEPREPRDLIVAASNSRIVALDNISALSAWLSDGLCRLSTGGGYSARTLYTDGDETIVDVMRPVILTGIEDFVSRPDLLDRAMLVTLAPIAEADRRTEAELFRELDRVRPSILGGLCSAVSTGLGRLDKIKLSPLPRMADFALWVTACAPGLGWDDRHFIDIYSANRAGANDSALEASIVGAGIVKLVESQGRWEGTAAELLTVLENALPLDRHNNPVRPYGWPKSPRSLSGQLRRVASNLRAAGIEVTFERAAGGSRARTVRVEKVRETPSHTVPPSQNPAGAAETASEAGRSGTIGTQTGRSHSANRPAENTGNTGFWDGRDGRDANSRSHSEEAPDDVPFPDPVDEVRI